MDPENKSPINILFLAPTMSIGGATLLNSLLKEFVTREEVGNIYLAASSHSVDLQNLTIFEHPKIITELLDFNDQKDLQRLREMEKACDVCYNFWPHLPFYLEITIPTAIIVQDMTLFEFPELLNDGTNVEIYFDIFTKYLDHADIICTSSQTTIDKIRLFYGDKYDKKFQIVKHALFEGFEYDPKTVIDKYQYITKKKYLICISNTSTHKNLQTVIESYALREKKDFDLVFIGYGTHVLSKKWKYKDARHWVDLLMYGAAKRLKLKLDENIIGLGVVSDLEKYYLLSHAQGLIMPSKAEGGGSYPVEESIFLKKPVIVSDIQIMREAMSNHSAEVLWFNPSSVDSLNEAIDKLFKNYDQYLEAVASDKRTDDLSWPKIVTEYLNVFFKTIKISSKKYTPLEIDSIDTNKKDFKTTFRHYLNEVLKLVKFILPYGIIVKYHEKKQKLKK